MACREGRKFPITTKFQRKFRSMLISTLKHRHHHAQPIIHQIAQASGMPRAVGGVGALERPEPEPHRAPARSPVSTCIGTPDGMSRIETAHALTALVNEAYGCRRVSDWDMQHRLRAGSRAACHLRHALLPQAATHRPHLNLSTTATAHLPRWQGATACSTWPRARTGGWWAAAPRRSSRRGASPAADTGGYWPSV